MAYCSIIHPFLRVFFFSRIRKFLLDLQFAFDFFFHSLSNRHLLYHDNNWPSCGLYGGWTIAVVVHRFSIRWSTHVSRLFIFFFCCVEMAFPVVIYCCSILVEMASHSAILRIRKKNLKNIWLIVAFYYMALFFDKYRFQLHLLSKGKSWTHHQIQNKLTAFNEKSADWVGRKIVVANSKIGKPSKYDKLDAIKLNLI